VSNRLIASIAIESPLPQLDRLFDYEVSAELSRTIAVGQRVSVVFGTAKIKHSGFVVSLSSTTEFSGKLATLDEVISEASVLTGSIYQTCRAIADRQATALGDVLRMAIPKRSVAVEKKWLAEQTDAQASSQSVASSIEARKTTAIVRPVVDRHPAWVSHLGKIALKTLESGSSAILCVPDFRDIALLDSWLLEHSVTTVVFDNEAKASKNYAAFLKCLEAQPRIIVGNRSVLLAPAHNLGLIALWDDGDPSHLQQQSPYIHSRDLAMVRQSIEQCSLHFAAHSRSAEIQRLVEIGFLTDSSEAFPIPRIAITESVQRLDTTAWQAIRDAAKVGPVLIQVARKGNSSALYCSNCSRRAVCKACAGPIWVNDQNFNACRWCNRISNDVACLDCGGRKFKQGRAGATRTVAELGRMFPGVKIVESTADQRLQTVSAKAQVVVATPGAEPLAEGGYLAVVILDCDSQLSKDSLRATEDAVRIWSNALALMSSAGRAVLVGLGGKLGQQLALWSQQQLSIDELASRRELKFPPACRVVSIESDLERLTAVSDSISALHGLEIFGPTATPSGLQRLLVKFPYSAGGQLAAQLKTLSLANSIGGARTNAKSGRQQRALRVKMDDPEVI
jgi:primosomal protein N' (replication factor Y)